MAFDNPVALLALFALSAAFAGAWARRSAFYRKILKEESDQRFVCIDGLRGFLALGVLASHSANIHSHHATGVWDPGIAHIYELAGEIGVSLFFMITAFLFWQRALRGTLEPASFYASRLRRLVPMYAASVIVVLAIVAILTGFQLREPPLALAKELRAWWSFGFVPTGGLNGVPYAHHINAVYWTLAYEWSFYIALPFLALFARSAWWVLVFAVAALYAQQAPIVLHFISGAIAAVVVQSGALRGHLRSPLAALAGGIALASVFLLPTAFGLAPSLLLLVFFLCVVHGNSFFGALNGTGARMLGLVSYSVYLLHCIVLFLLVHGLDAFFGVRSLGAAQYWLVVALAAAITVAISAFTYRWIEHPFLSGAALPGLTFAGRSPKTYRSPAPTAQ